MAEVLERLAAAVTPIRWCTPRRTPEVTAAVKEAAQSSQQSVALDLTYPEVPTQAILPIIAEARSHLGSASPALVTALSDHLDSLEDTVATLSQRDDAAFTEWSLRRYGLPSRRTLMLAGEALRAPRDPSKVPDKVFTASDLAASIRSALDGYLLEDWLVTLENTVAKVTVRAAKREVTIRADALFTEGDVARLLVHEVGAHVLRSANAQAQPDPIAATPIGDATPTEEGLACWLEEWAAVASPSQRRTYAARAVAVDLAVQHGILETVRILAPAVGWDEAVTVSIRAKRGLHDFNSPGGYSKDHAYLSGLTEVSAALQADPELLPILMSNKWPLSLQGAARQLLQSGGLVPSARLPHRETLGI